MKRTTFIVAGCGILLALLCTVSLFFTIPSSSDSTMILVEVPAGGSLRAVARSLETKGVVPSARRFELLVRMLGRERKIQMGEYGFQMRSHPIHVLNTLVAGRVVRHKITIPEGYAIDQMAPLFVERQIADPEEFKRITLDPEQTTEFEVPGPTLEGYLFPTTYYFPRGFGARQVIKEMVAHYKQAWEERWQRRMLALRMSEKEVVTLASIIEKETGDPSERSTISSVYHNRLVKGMRLQADPTVIYGVKNFDGNLTRKHLETTTPYNTYKISGLPKGPIASPGRASIEAALFPAETPYLYFVASRDGKHLFSVNYKDHQAKVYEHQIRRRRRK